jgi:hypothetical protein
MKLVTRIVLALMLLTPIAVSSQTASPGIPAPASVFGFEPGADDKLATYVEVVDYFRRVDAASDRVALVNAGETSRGRTFYFALVSSPQNLQRIDALRAIARRLAHPDGLTDEAARKLADSGRAFVHIDGGLHSTEVAAPQHTPLLLHTLVSRAAAGDRDVLEMLDNVVVMLWPTINPDGHQMVAEWQAQRTAGGTPNAPLPGLYQEYVGHDNNRDAYMLNMIESRVLEHTWRAWEPNIIYVHHQSSPPPTRIWLPPFADPIALHAPPIVSREVNMIGMAIAKGLEERGQTGATHLGDSYDAWYPGYIDYMPVFRNIPAFWTETFGRGASPVTTAPEQIPARMRYPSSMYPGPWPGGTWRLRDAVDYMHTASLSVIEYASKYRVSLLLNRYRSGRVQIAQGRTMAPYAYVVPQAQRDPVAAVELLRRLAFGGVRVMQLASPVALGGQTFPTGTWVVPTDQEFAAVARELLDVQRYPEVRASPDSPLDPPYDAAGWTLPISMGIRVVSIDAPLSPEARAAMRALAPAPAADITFTPYVSSSTRDAAPFDSVPGLGFDSDPAAKAIVPPPGRVTGSGDALALTAAANNTFRALNQAWTSGATVRFAAAAGDRDARYVIAGLSPSAQADLVGALALQGERVAAATGEPMRRPRLGMFQQMSGMDHGWTRWVLEQYGFEPAPIAAEDLQAGGLRSRLDVLILTDDAQVLAGGPGAGRGGAPGGGAAPGSQTPASHARIVAIDQFVRAGGTLVCFNRASQFAIAQLKLPVENAVAGINRREFTASGSLLRVEVDTGHRVMAGMPRDAAIYFDNSPVFAPGPEFRGTILARYAESGSPLLSGFILGEKHLYGRAAAVEVEHGNGRIVLFGFRPQWRGQPFGTFRTIFNAAVYAR